MARVRPLNPGQQKFLQMLMARHVLSDTEAQDLFAALSAQAQEDDHPPLGRSLEHCLGVINDSLSAGFGLEIKTVSLDRRCAGPIADKDADEAKAKDEDETEEGARKSSAKSKSAKTKNTVRYHAVVNKVADPASKSTFMTATAASAPHHSSNVRTPHEMAYLRLIVEKIIERGMDLDVAAAAGSGSGGAEGVGAGSRGCLGRISILNLRNELEGPHEGKVSLAQAQHALACLIGEKWLVATNPPEEDDNDEDGDGDDDEETEGPSAGKRKRSGRKGRSGGRTSLDGLGGDGPALSHVMVGPRTYMELPDLLKDCGLERVPQFILHSGR